MPMGAAARPNLDRDCVTTDYWEKICFFTAPDGRSCALASRRETGIALDCDWPPPNN